MTATQPRQRSARFLAAAAWVAAGFVVLLLIMIVALLGRLGPTEAAGGNVAVIRVEGPIATSGGDSLFGASAGSDELAGDIRDAADDKQIKAIVLRINSPGGSPAAAQEIYAEVRRARKKGKVVVASLGDLAASGGYYIAAGADHIVADPGTLTGSIGVIFMQTDLSGLFRKVGANVEVLKMGRYKDMTSGQRPLTAEEREMTLAMLGDIYDQFVDAVAEGRKLPREKVLQVATGRIFTGRQAMKLHLVDELGGYLDAVDLAGKKAGVRPKVVEYGHDSVLDWLVGSAETRTGLENLAADPRMAAAQSILRWGAPWGN